MICNYCQRARPEDQMVRLGLCVGCHADFERQNELERQDIELFRCCVCKHSPPWAQRMGDQAPSKPGGYVCGTCWWAAWWEMFFEARRSGLPWEDREREVDHSETQEHSDWWDAERRLWTT
jgi:hypothetical protein